MTSSRSAATADGPGASGAAGAPAPPADGANGGATSEINPTEPLDSLLWRLHSSPEGLSQREADRRLISEGANELQRQSGRRWPSELLRQFTHPLALVLAAAGALALANRTPLIAGAIAAVIVLNAFVAFFQEMQAESAVEALARYLPARAAVLRDGHQVEVEARTLVPGDVIVLGEGDRVCADARLLSGELEIDLSMLTGESLPAARSARASSPGGALLDAHNLVFSGTSCTGGDAHALVTRTGMRTELGRIAALSQRTRSDPSPLERQMKRVAWLIAFVATGVAAAFLPLGAAAGLSFTAALGFSIGLLVANVPEGLLPTITLALAVGVRDLAGRGAVVKRLSAIETLGSTTVVCTDKTGTLTANEMGATLAWTSAGTTDLTAAGVQPTPTLRALAHAGACCTTALQARDTGGAAHGDPTELALLGFADMLGTPVWAVDRDAGRRRLLHFDPHVKRMSTIDLEAGGAVLHTKGAPESVLPLCSTVLDVTGVPRELGVGARERVAAVGRDAAAHGLRVLAVAEAHVAVDRLDAARAELERDLCLLGLVGLLDPPRPEVAGAVREAHTAGIRVHVVTGDSGLTAREVARRVGIGDAASPLVTGDELDRLSEAELDELLERGPEIVFARSAPEAKLRITDALRELGEVVAVTGDGVNDAPALRRADIGVAMGRSGTDVAREAATMVLTDDNFATIVTAVRDGRRVFDNVRKFVLYIFTHLMPELVPFLVFALSGGAVPPPLTVMEVLAIDLGTDTLPALALSREPAEPDLMARPPRRQSTKVIDASTLLRSWGFLGIISAALVMAGYFLVLERAGWHPHAPTGPGTPLHDAYLQATSVAWLGIVFCQIGAAFAVRSATASVRTIGLARNRALLGGVAFSLAFAAGVIYAPPLESLFGTHALGVGQLAVVLPYPFIVWGADEIRKAVVRQRRRRASAAPTAAR